MDEEIKYIRRSKYRKNVMKSLEKYPKMPSEIARDCEIANNHISHTLKQLKELGVVKCLNPEVRKGRVYLLTEKGEKVVKKL